MAIQLSLALPAPIALEQRLWFLSAHPDDLPKLGEALRSGGSALIDARSGLRAIAPLDLAMVRTGDDRYLPFGCAGPLAAGSISTESVVDLASPIGQRGCDLLCLAPGRAAVEDDVPAGTPIENLFRLLRTPSLGLSPQLRSQLCGQALSTLDRDQDVLAAILEAQAVRLERKVSLRKSLPGLDFGRRHALRQSRLGWIERASDPRAIPPRPVVHDLFGAPVGDGAPRDMSFDAFRVAAICVPIRPERQLADFARFIDQPALGLDERALSKVIAQVTSFRIRAATALVDRRRLSVSIDYEIRHRFERLVSKRATSDHSLLRLESIAGSPVGPIRRVRLGERVEFDVPEHWETPDGIKGCVVYTAGGGLWARQSIDLSICV